MIADLAGFINTAIGKYVPQDKNTGKFILLSKEDPEQEGMHLWLPSDSFDGDDNQRQGKIDNDYGVLRAMQELLTKHVDSISGNANLLAKVKKAMNNNNLYIRTGKMASATLAARKEFAQSWHNLHYEDYRERKLPQGWPSSLIQADIYASRAVGTGSDMTATVRRGGAADGGGNGSNNTEAVAAIARGTRQETKSNLRVR